MTSEPFSAAARNANREVGNELDELKHQLDQLAQIVKQNLATQDGREAVPDEQSPLFGRLHKTAAGR